MLVQNFVEPNQRRRASLKNINHPAQRDNRKRKLHHVNVEGREAANFHAARQHLAAPDPQNQYNRQSQHEFQRGPQHPHEPHQLQAARNVFLVCSFKACDLSLFLHIGADQAGSGEIFLCPRGNVGEHRLDSFEALMNAASEVLNDDADHRQGQKRVERQLGADAHHERQRRRSEHQRIRRVHNGRAQQHAHRVQVICHPGHDVASAHALVIRIGKRFQMGKEIVAQVELYVARDADHHPAGQEQEDAANRGELQHLQSKVQKLGWGDAGVEIVHRMTDHLRQ